MIDLLKAALFVSFVVVAVWVATRRDDRRRAMNAMALFFVAATLAVGLTNHDAWPFATYPLVPSRYREDMVVNKLDYRGVDAAGKEHPVDAHSFAPVFPLAVDIWFEKFYAKLPVAEQREAIAFLGRAAQVKRHPLPVAAPDWWLYPDVPASSEAIHAMRVYRETWRPGERYADPNAVQRRLLGEASW